APLACTRRYSSRAAACSSGKPSKPSACEKRTTVELEVLARRASSSAVWKAASSRWSTMYCATSFCEREHSSKRARMYLERVWCSLALAACAELLARGELAACARGCSAPALRALRARAPARRLSVVGAATRFIGGCVRRGRLALLPALGSVPMRRTLFHDVHEDFRSSFRTFLEREVVGDEGRYGEWERAGIVPREVFARAGAGGFLGMSVPERYGGAGADDFRFNLIVGEEAQRAGVSSFGLGITLQNDICLPYFLTYCSEAQRERWLPGITCGALITAIAMSEPGMGSDLAAMSTRARREGDRYVLDGAKTFITNGINADLVIVAAKTDPRERHRGISLLVVERGMDGFTRGRNLEKIGQHGQDTAELFVAGVHVPAETLH